MGLNLRTLIYKASDHCASVASKNFIEKILLQEYKLIDLSEF